MLEVIRYGLALIVTETHLWPIGITETGWQAVFAFYTLSGFLITRVLHERYGFTVTGTASFMVNRVLRLWPAYLVVVVGTALALNFLPLQNFFYSLFLPRSWPDKLTNITILGQVAFDFEYSLPMARPAPTSWSLSIELFCYCLLALYFARTPRRLAALAGIGAAALLVSTGHCWLRPSPNYGLYCFQNRYGVLQAGFIPFAAGGLAWCHRAPLRRWLVPHWRWLAASLLAGEVLAFLDTFTATTIGPFFGVVGMGAMVAAIGSTLTRRSRTIDFIGRASYHLFIAHMSIAAVVVVGLSWAPGGFLLFALTSALALALSGFLVPIEWRLDRVRQRISGRAMPPAALPRNAAPALSPVD